MHMLGRSSTLCKKYLSILLILFEHSLMTFREEFKRHKNADQKFVGMFLQEWTSYLDNLKMSSSEGFGVGRSLTDEQIAALSPEQREQLQKLKESSEAVGRNPIE
jgi:hypothetical protein